MKKLSIGIFTFAALLSSCGRPGLDDTSAADGAINIDRARITAASIQNGDGSEMSPEETQAVMQKVVANIPSDGQPPMTLTGFTETDNQGRGIHGSGERGFFAAGYGWTYPYRAGGGAFNGPYRTGYASCVGGVCNYGVYNKVTGTTRYGTCTRTYGYGCY